MSAPTFAQPLSHAAPRPFDIESIRADFPVLHQQLQGKPLVYFDNAATTQKPQVVIDALSHYYQHDNANIHRGLHSLAERATAAYEATRDRVQALLNAAHREEIIFTRGTTEGINLVAHVLAEALLQPGDEVLISTMEHHSNIVPWQLACQRSGATLRVMPVTDSGEIDLDEALPLVTERTKVMALVYVSNSLGTINPVETLLAAARQVGALTLLDGAQALSHMQVDVQALGCDFLVFSSHKLFGPTGVGVLYGRLALLQELPPYQGGGEMISEVSFENTTYNELPYKYEAGTPNIGDTIALKAAIDYVEGLGHAAIAAHEGQLLAHLQAVLQQVPGLRLVGTAQHKVCVQSFVIDGVHPQDLGILLDQFGVAVRTGHHCTQPLMARYGLPGTVRASLAFYNTVEEVDLLGQHLQRAVRMLA